MIRALGGVLLLAALSACTAQSPPSSPVRHSLQLQSVSFSDLPGWSQDRHAEALAAFRRSCERIIGLPAEAPANPTELAGQVGDWQSACRAATIVGSGQDEAARSFFEHLFRPYRLSDPSTGVEGLVTGYYLPLVQGSLKREPGFDTPLYRRPPDLAPQSAAAQGMPYFSRAEIDRGVLAGRGLELVWLASPIDAFFVSIQGSAAVGLDDGERLNIGYDGSNGQPYVPIGRVLVQQGEMTPDQVSLQTLRAWLMAHPDRAQALMEQNPRYIFFHENAGDAAMGAEGVALTPGRSLAIDPSFLPFGAPIYVDTRDGNEQPLRRLMLAQDSGAAIKGPLRGDVFWGEGAAAEQEAGPMKSPAQFYLLLPIGLTPSASGSQS
jgi:membrane-bound lytic murein transglycosylase A